MGLAQARPNYTIIHMITHSAHAVYSNQTLRMQLLVFIVEGGPVVGSCCCVGRHPGTSGSEFL